MISHFFVLIAQLSLISYQVIINDAIIHSLLFCTFQHVLLSSGTKKLHFLVKGDIHAADKQATQILEK